MSHEVLKKMLLEDNKAFCMYPWIHLHTTPTGKAAPCCIAQSCANEVGVGDARKQSLMELVNSPKMNQLRLDMLDGVRNKECNKCYLHEDQGIFSSRQAANRDYAYALPEVIDYTNLEDGSLTKFEMRYFDIRFSNICNFKCRTCGAAYSSQWENEDLKHKMIGKPVPKNDNPAFLQDVIEQIDYMQVAYFAGGEPLITEEHYILLEEMIRRKKTDIVLKYNTNLSNFKFKDKDLLSLWKQFDYKVSIYASIDHYGERAEYIRTGTNWGTVENNFLLAKQQPFIDLQINTVVSVFNVLTIFEFYDYLLKKHMLRPEDYTYSLYNTTSPAYFSAHILPKDMKKHAVDKLSTAKNMLQNLKFSADQITHFQNAINWLGAKDTWDEQKQAFRDEVNRLDKIRNESFEKVFPELAPLLDDKKMASSGLRPLLTDPESTSVSDYGYKAVQAESVTASIEEPIEIEDTPVDVEELQKQLETEEQVENQEEPVAQPEIKKLRRPMLPV